MSTLKEKIRFSVWRWYFEEKLEMVEDLQNRHVKVVGGKEYKTFKCGKTTEIYSSPNKNVGCLYYPKTREGVIVYAKSGYVSSVNFTTQLPLKSVEFNLNRVYLEDIGGNNQTLTCF